MGKKKSSAKKAVKIEGVGSVADAAARALARPESDEEALSPEQAAELKDRFARSFDALRTVRREPVPSSLSGSMPEGSPAGACPFGGGENCPHEVAGVCPHELVSEGA